MKYNIVSFKNQTLQVCSTTSIFLYLFIYMKPIRSFCFYMIFKNKMLFIFLGCFLEAAWSSSLSTKRAGYMFKHIKINK